MNDLFVYRVRRDSLGIPHLDVACRRLFQKASCSETNPWSQSPFLVLYSPQIDIPPLLLPPLDQDFVGFSP